MSINSQRTCQWISHGSDCDNQAAYRVLDKEYSTQPVFLCEDCVSNVRESNYLEVKELD